MDVTQQHHNHRFAGHLERALPVLAILSIAGLFFPSIAGLYERWIKWDEGLAHGLIIIGIFLYFALKSAPWQTHTQSHLGHLSLLILLALASCSWFLFHLANIYILEQLLLLPLLSLLVAAIFGWRTSYQHLMLLAMPIFAIPIWDQLNDPLVNLSSFVVGHMVQAINMPAMIDGNSIFIPSGHIVIADGCSGLRYLEIALSLGYLISYLNRYSPAKLLFVLGIAALLGLIANWLRIFILVIVGYQTEMQSSLMSDHEYFGWFLFACICFPVIYFAPVVGAEKNPKTRVNTQKHRLLLPFLAIAIGPILNLFINIQPHSPALKDLLDFSLQPITAKKMPLQITSPKADHSETVRSSSGVFIQLDQYQRQLTSDKLVPFIGRLYSNEKWTLETQQTYSSGQLSAKLSVFKQKSVAKKVAQLQWFDVAGTVTHSLAIAKLLQIPALIQRKNHFMIVSLQANCSDDSCSSAIAQLQASAQALQLNTKGN
jgi:exosortase